MSKRDAISKHYKRGGLRAVLLALLFHAGLIALLFVGVRWNTKNPEPIQIEIFTPPSVATVVERPVAEVERPAVTPPPAEPVKPQVVPIPKLVAQPDIALEKKKQEKLEQAQFEKEQLAKDKLEKAKLEKEKTEKADKIAKAEKALKAEKSAQEADENIKKLVADQQRQAGAQTGAVAGAKTGTADPNYAGRVKAAVVRNTVFRTDDLVGSPASDFRVTLTPDCTVRDVKLLKASGNNAWDQAAERAIRKTDPFPTPADGKCPPYQDLTHRPSGSP